MIPGRILLGAILLLASMAFPRETVDEALQSLAKEAAAANGARTPRLSVVGIAPASGGDNRFGAWLGEALVGEIRRQGKFKLYERSRLDEVAREHSLALSGAIGADEARKVGELAPVDLLLCGTWTRLGDEVETNLRLLDAVTGEVHQAIRRKIPLDEGHKGLFEPVPVAAAVARDPSECSVWADSVQARLSDLSGEAQVRRLEEALVRLTLDGSKCDVGHYRAMSLLEKQKVPTPRYRAFLLSTLDTMALPTDDERGGRIVQHLFRTGPVDDREWSRIEVAVPRSRRGGISGFLSAAFSATPADPATQHKRLARILDLARDGKIGRPLILSYDEVFLGLLRDVQPNREANPDDEAWWFWKTFSPNLVQLDDESSSARSLRREGLELLHRPGSEVRQKELGDWMCARWAKLQDPRTLSGDVYSHLVWMDARPDRKAELEREGKACAEPFLRAAKANPYRSQTHDLRRLGIRHGWEMPGFVPSLAELVDSIKSPNWQAFIPAGELLVDYGPRAAPVLPEIVKRLRRLMGNGNSYSYSLRANLVAVVGNVGVSDTATIGLLVDILSVYGSYADDSAVVALGKIGPKALPLIDARWPAVEDHIRIGMVHAVAGMPRDARIVAWLRKRKAGTTQPDLLRSIDEVLDP